MCVVGHCFSSKTFTVCPKNVLNFVLVSCIMQNLKELLILFQNLSVLQRLFTASNGESLWTVNLEGLAETQP